MKTRHPAVENEQLAFNLQPEDGSADEIITVEKSVNKQIPSQSSSDVIFHVQLVPIHRFIFISPSWFQMTGYTPEELEADHELLQKIVHPDDIKIFKTIKGTYEDITRPVVLRWVHKDGMIIWTEQTRTVIRNENGEPQALYIVVRDMTEYRKTSTALEASEKKFSSVFQASPNPVCIINLEKEIFIDVNDSFLRASGYTREEIIDRTPVEMGLLANNADLAMVRNLLEQKGKISNQEIHTRTKSGEIRINLVAAEIVKIAGSPCVVLAITDISEQKWAEDALKESEAFTSSLLKNNPNPIFVVYPDSAIKYVNPAFENLTGYALTDIIGIKSPYPWWPLENMDYIKSTLKVTHFGRGLIKEMEYQKKNGERFWVELTATAINKNGMREYILVNWVDITERKQMEEALRFSDAALKSIHESIITVDNNRNITYWNNISEQLYGIKASEAIGKSLKDIIKPLEEYPGQSLERIKKLN
jgi:PAS domain S-box-containing protein